MLTRYGTDNILIMIGVGLILLITAFLTDNKIISIPVYALGIILILFTFWFFRDPDRKIPEEVLKDNSLLIAPADGKIVAIELEDERHFRKSNSKRISIFLSPIDVHVNRSPVTGTVDFYEYIPGDYLVAYHPKSSELNEHSRIGVTNEYGKVFFKQIVGILARRIVCELKVGDKIKAGEKFGMMKFGSRMDIAIDPNSEIFVKIGQKVIAGQTIIAKLKKTEDNYKSN